MTTYHWSLPEAVTAIRAANYGGIGVWLQRVEEYGEDLSVALLRHSGLAVSSLAWVGGLIGNDVYSFREAIDAARHAIQLAGRMRARCLLVASGSRSGHTHNHAGRLLVGALQTLADEAASHDVVLALQPMPFRHARKWSFLGSLNETVDILDRVNHPSVGLALDAFHSGTEPQLIERIPQLADFIATVELCDHLGPVRSLYDRCLPGEGDLPVERITSALLEANYSGFFEMMIWSKDLWKSDYHQLLERCWSSFQRSCTPQAGLPTV